LIFILIILKMAHQAQIDYCMSVKKRFPDYFKNKRVLDAGSMDINGNNRYLFKDCDYTGLDIGPGKNVDIICPVHCFIPTKRKKWGGRLLQYYISYDVVISTEMLEHDKYYKKSLQQMFCILNSPGLLLITAATTGRNAHGTYATDEFSSPYTLDYYRNITPGMIREALNPDWFLLFELDVFKTDIRLIAIKK